MALSFTNRIMDVYACSKFSVGVQPSCNEHILCTSSCLAQCHIHHVTNSIESAIVSECFSAEKRPSAFTREYWRNLPLTGVLLRLSYNRCTYHSSPGLSDLRFQQAMPMHHSEQPVAGTLSIPCFLQIPGRHD